MGKNQLAGLIQPSNTIQPTCVNKPAIKNSFLYTHTL